MRTINKRVDSGSARALTPKRSKRGYEDDHNKRTNRQRSNEAKTAGHVSLPMLMNTECPFVVRTRLPPLPVPTTGGEAELSRQRQSRESKESEAQIRRAHCCATHNTALLSASFLLSIVRFKHIPQALRQRFPSIVTRPRKVSEAIELQLLVLAPVSLIHLIFTLF